MDAACEAGCGVVNGIPELIASTPAIADKCKKAGIPVIGDDWKSQLGATIVHRALAKLFEDRGIKITSPISSTTLEIQTLSTWLCVVRQSMSQSMTRLQVF